MSDLVTRLRASVRMGANDGNGVERMVCGKQMLEAADEIERLRTELAEARKDAERLDWVMHKVSGAEWRRLGIIYSGGCTRDAIDAALAQESKHD